MDLATLNAAVKNSAAIRLRRRLQPAGGAGDKVFPPTYEGATYAEEQRVIDGQRVPCVLLDSVQSQANRMELALLAAHRAGKITIPVVGVTFPPFPKEANGEESKLGTVGTITSLEAPHRLADAILRDSLNDGVKFRDSAAGKCLDNASTTDATDLYRLCPTALVMGVWDSTGPRGGMGAKFQRALVGELVGVDAQTGAKPASRLDPLGIQLNAGPVYRTADGLPTIDAAFAVQKEGKALLFGKKKKEDVWWDPKSSKEIPDEGRPSKANHGNVTPSLKNEETNKPHHGGITMAYAQQSVVISLPALRRLSFPLKGKSDADLAARTVLAALGLCGAVLSVDLGCDLRSRCLLIPDTAHPSSWEIVGADGKLTSFTLTGEQACELLKEAVKAAAAVGLTWTAKDKENGLTLQPSPGLLALVKKSRELALTPAGEE
jgi:CRISPR-associated protein Csb1